MSTSINRRKFIQTTGLATLVTATNGWVFANNQYGEFQLSYHASGRALTPFFLGEDLLRLVQLSDLDKRIKQALTVNHNYFHLGKAWRIDQKELLGLAKKAKTLWDSEQNQDNAQIQLALVAGWAAHQAFQQQLPDCSSPKTGKSFEELPDEVLYQDTYVIKMLQNADPHRKKIMPDQPLIRVAPEDVAELLHLIQQRNLIRMHTTRPEFSDVQTWLDNFLDYYERLKKDNFQYGQVYCLPDAEKVNKYITKNDFYNPADALIQTARNFQMGKVDEPAKLKAAISQSPTATSLYGTALQTALQKVKICGNFVTGKATEGDLQQVLQG